MASFSNEEGQGRQHNGQQKVNKHIFDKVGVGHQPDSTEGRQDDPLFFAIDKISKTEATDKQVDKNFY